MPNLDALLDANLVPSGTGKCLLGRTVDELPEPYKTAMRELLASSTASDLVSYRLREAGLKGSDRTIQRHRRGICGCPAEVAGE
jgi:hypothetical protein